MNKMEILQKKESSNKLETLVNHYKLNPNLLKYWEEGKLYYSYITGNGLLASVDTIGYNPKYEELVLNFERTTGSIVYHAIETGHFLSLLYVDKPSTKRSEEEQIEYWDSIFVPELNCINAYVINLEDSKFSEFGDIFLFSYQGALLRDE